MILLKSIKWSLFFVFTVNLCTQISAQNQQLDTLKSVEYFMQKHLNTFSSNPDSIKAYYCHALENAIQTNDDVYQLLTSAYLAHFYKQIVIKDSCKKYAELASSLIHLNNNKNPHINYEINRALITSYYYLGNFIKTIHHAKSALQFPNHNYPNKEIEKLLIYDYLTISYSSLENYDSVMFYIKQSEKELNAMLNPPKSYILRTISHKGRALSDMGKRDEALDVLLEGVPLIDINHPSNTAANIYFYLGHIYYTTRELDKSIQYYKQVLKIYEQLNFPTHPYFTRVYTTMGQVYSLMNEYEAALHYLKKNLLIKSQNNDRSLMSDYQSIASVYMEMDSLALADKYLNASLEILDKYFKKQQPITYANGLFYYGHFKIARLHNKDGVRMTKTAMQILGDYFGATNPTIAECYEYLGFAKMLIDGDPVKALEYYQQALIANDSVFNNTTISENPKIENALSKKIFFAILKDKADALNSIIRSTPDTIDCIKDIELMNNTLLLAIETIKSIQTSYTSMDSKLKLNERTEELYEKLISSSFLLYRKTNEIKFLNDAYEYAAKSKLATLNGLINEDGAKISGNVPQELLKYEKDLKIRKGQLSNELYNIESSAITDQKSIETLREKLFNTDQKIDLLTAELENKYQKYYNLKYRSQSFGMNTIQKMISENQAIIEYYLSDSSIFEFVITKDTFNAINIKIEPDFRIKIDSLAPIFNHNTFTHFDKAQFLSFKKNAYDLYQILFKPLAFNLTNKELIIVPDKELLHLPFEVLLTRPAYMETNYGELPYLINDYPISYSYSTEWLFDQSAKKIAKKNLMVIVPSYDTNVDYKNLVLFENKKKERDILSPIPAALREAKHITKSIHGKILRSENATEAQFKKLAGNYSILHFAMHTIIDNENPMFSKLVFTSSSDDTLRNEDNMLNTYEIFNLELNAQMVVLSSCKSGFGQIQKGEGIMSMARGFMFAGCPSLAITLWSVDDQSSSDLMTTYYEYLAMGVTKSKALQMAKKEFILNSDPIHTHPHFWASHILVGDTKQIQLNRNSGLINYVLVVTILLIFTIIYKWKLIEIRKLFQRRLPDNNHSY